MDVVTGFDYSVAGAFEAGWPVFVVLGIALLLIVLMIALRATSYRNESKASSELLLERVRHLEGSVSQLQAQVAEAIGHFDTTVAEVRREVLEEQGEGAPLGAAAEAPAEDLPQAVSTPAESRAKPLLEAQTETQEATTPKIEADVATESSITSGMTRTRTTFLGRLKNLFRSKPKIDPASLDDLEEALIASDVGARSAAELVERVRGEVQAQRDVDETALTTLLKGGIRSLLIPLDPGHRLYMPAGQTLVVLVVGVNGVGKTTTVAKLAARYTGQGKRVLAVAADTFRAAAVQQLEEWSNRIGFDVVKGPENAKPASVVFDGMVRAKDGGYDVVLIDTAGRLHTKSNLMQELEGVRNAIKRHIPDAPHETVLVLDGVSGQNALAQARQFNEAVALSGVIVTKLDGTPKGGIIVPISQELKIPVVYVGVGEKASDLLPFSADEFVESLFEARAPQPELDQGVFQRAQGADL